MPYLSGGDYYGEFTTAHPVTGAAADADATPTATATRDGIDDPSFALTVTHLDVGAYAVAGTVPATYQAGDFVQIRVKVTVAGVEGTGVVDRFQIDAPVEVSSAVAYAPPAELYCTDEDIAVRAMGDYPSIVPPSQLLAHATDGVFTSGNRWWLTSATADLYGAGVHAGNVAWLTRPAASFGAQGELFAVDAVGLGGVLLRRVGRKQFVGQPPAPAAGLTGVEFRVLTFDPQIETATFEINELYGIDPTVPELSAARLTNPRQLQQLCALWVLERAYGLQMKRREEDFALKHAQLEEELEDLRSRVVVRRGPHGSEAAPSGLYGTRIRRG
jgi:hypothetical protein